MKVARYETMYLPSKDGIVLIATWDDGFSVSVEGDRWSYPAGGEGDYTVAAKLRSILARLGERIPFAAEDAARKVAEATRSREPMSLADIDAIQLTREARQVAVQARQDSLYEPEAVALLARLLVPRVTPPALKARPPREKTDADYLREGEAEVERILAEGLMRFTEMVYGGR